MLRTALFRSRQFDAINWATLLFYGALAAASYLVVLQCELRLGYSATEAGAALIPESAVFLLVSPLVGGLVARVGTRWPMAAGILIVAGGFGWLSTAQPGSPYAQAILPGAILWGLGIGLAVAPLTAGVLAAVDDSDLGEASAINDAASRVGGVVLVALVPALLGAGSAGGLGRPLAEQLPDADAGDGRPERRRRDHHGVVRLPRPRRDRPTTGRHSPVSRLRVPEAVPA